MKNISGFETDLSLRDHLSLSYPELEVFNLEIKEEQQAGKSSAYFKEKITTFLERESRLKAITVAFSDLEGKLQMLDYDKKFFLGAIDNLTFDGSSISGFTDLGSSDLRLKADFGSFRLLPSDIFGTGKAIVFASVRNIDGTQFCSDFRGVLQEKLELLKKDKNYNFLVAPEVEGFLL
ncbi:TPA: glutamine synthetase, partial [Candidatus Peregrinibacteria bacterium]|nr:glutamine synthetase [Candidatus Peregrinibacteria bacterium]